MGDVQQVEAHKVILASSSPFFLNILKRNKHPHPLIYMSGLTFENLVAMIDFLYNGEANVYQENLDSFLAVAEELQLKGLMGSGAEEEVVSSNNEHPPDGITQTPNKRNCNGSTLEKEGKEATLEETLANKDTKQKTGKFSKKKLKKKGRKTARSKKKPKHNSTLTEVEPDKDVEEECTTKEAEVENCEANTEEENNTEEKEKPKTSDNQ